MVDCISNCARRSNWKTSLTHMAANIWTLERRHIIIGFETVRNFGLSEFRKKLRCLNLLSQAETLILHAVYRKYSSIKTACWNHDEFELQRATKDTVWVLHVMWWDFSDVQKIKCCFDSQGFRRDLSQDELHVYSNLRVSCLPHAILKDLRLVFTITVSSCLAWGLWILLFYMFWDEFCIGCLDVYLDFDGHVQPWNKCQIDSQCFELGLLLRQSFLWNVGWHCWK